MADLVEYVIDGIMKREQMQQHAKMQQAKRARINQSAGSQNNGGLNKAGLNPRTQNNLTKTNGNQHQVNNAVALRSPQTFKLNHASLHSVGTQAPAPIKERDEALWKVSRQFEAIFVQQMMSEMRKSVNKSDFMPSGYAEDVHASMMDDAIAKASVKRSNFGIADNIYRQLDAANKVRMGSTQEQNIESKQNTELKQTFALKQNATAQEISNTADSLKMGSSLVMEARQHAN